MPIPDWNEPDAPQTDTRMFEFVERRREEQARARRQRIQLVAIAALGLIGIVLTVSNAVLVSRLIARPVTPPAVLPPPARSAAPVEREPAAGVSSESALAATAEPTRPAPAPSRATKSSRVAAATAPRDTSPPRADAEREPAARESVTNEAMPRETVPPPDERPSLPERPTRTPARPAPLTSERVPAAREGLSTAVETDPALRTARWMIHTYGPLDAEGKALAASQFYTGEEGSFWRRVVAHVRAER